MPWGSIAALGSSLQLDEHKSLGLAHCKWQAFKYNIDFTAPGFGCLPPPYSSPCPPPVAVTGFPRPEISSQLWYLLWLETALLCIGGVSRNLFAFVMPLNAFCLRKHLLKGLSMVREDKFGPLGVLDGHKALSVSASVRDLQSRHIKAWHQLLCHHQHSLFSSFWQEIRWETICITSLMTTNT